MSKAPRKDTPKQSKIFSSDKYATDIVVELFAVFLILTSLGITFLVGFIIFACEAIVRKVYSLLMSMHGLSFWTFMVAAFLALMWRLGLVR